MILSFDNQNDPHTTLLHEPAFFGEARHASCVSSARPEVDFLARLHSLLVDTECPEVQALTKS